MASPPGVPIASFSFPSRSTITGELFSSGIWPGRQ